jgi:hypothetical protein
MIATHYNTRSKKPVRSAKSWDASPIQFKWHKETSLQK